MAEWPAYKPWKNDSDFDEWAANLISPLGLAEEAVAMAKVSGARIKKGSHTEWAIKNAIVNVILDSRKTPAKPDSEGRE